MMAKADLEEIARILRKEHARMDVHAGGCPRTVLNVVGNKIAMWCSRSNPRFDWDRFAKACSPEAGEHTCGACKPPAPKFVAKDKAWNSRCCGAEIFYGSADEYWCSHCCNAVPSPRRGQR